MKYLLILATLSLSFYSYPREVDKYRRGAMFSCAYTLRDLKSKNIVNKDMDSWSYCRIMAEKISHKLKKMDEEKK